MITETDYAWAAGFIDGEGCFFVKRSAQKADPSRPHRYLGLSVGQVHDEVLFKLQRIIGGNIHSPKRRSSTGKQIYVLQLSNTNVITAAQLLWPYLGSIKKAQFWDCVDRVDKLNPLHRPRLRMKYAGILTQLD